MDFRSENDFPLPWRIAVETAGRIFPVASDLEAFLDKFFRIARLNPNSIPEDHRVLVLYVNRRMKISTFARRCIFLICPILSWYRATMSFASLQFFSLRVRRIFRTLFFHIVITFGVLRSIDSVQVDTDAFRRTRAGRKARAVQLSSSVGLLGSVSLVLERVDPMYVEEKSSRSNVEYNILPDKVLQYREPPPIERFFAKVATVVTIPYMLRRYSTTTCGISIFAIILLILLADLKMVTGCQKRGVRAVRLNARKQLLSRVS